MRSVFKVLVIGFAITLVALLFYLRHDTPARNYADLAVERREVPTDQNALTFLKAAKKKGTGRKPFTCSVPII